MKKVSSEVLRWWGVLAPVHVHVHTCRPLLV